MTRTMNDMHRLTGRIAAKAWRGRRSWPRYVVAKCVDTTPVVPYSVRAVKYYGQPVADTFGVGLSRQTMQLIAYAVLYGHTPNDYYRYRMYNSPARRVRLFMPETTNKISRELLYSRLSLDPVVLADKRVFYRVARENGLPIPHTVAEFDGGHVSWWSDKEIPQEDVFVKEAASLCGAGAARWDYVEGRWAGANGEMSGPELVRCLEEMSREAPYLLQRLLRNHEGVADLGDRGLCTVRLVTARHPQTGETEILLGAFRMPCSGGVADNFAQGGLGCPVDLESGVLGTAVQKSIAQAHKDLAAHPDSGAPVSGRTLPLWPEVRELALRAHEVFARYPTIGWDVAITPDGPVLIEGNYNWDVVLAQQPGCRPLGATRYPQRYFDWLEYARSAPTRPAAQMLRA